MLRGLTASKLLPKSPPSRTFHISAIASKAARILPSSNSVEVVWDDGKKSSFGGFWLRDHCKCGECWHPTTNQRLFDTFSEPRDIKPSTASCDKKDMKIHWPNGHMSTYSLDWLRRHSYDPAVAVPEVKQDHQKLFFWDSKALEKAPQPQVNYENVMEGDDGLRDWLRNIMKNGFSWVNGVPKNIESTEKLVRRIAFVRETHYGGFWDFSANLAHGDTAYTSLAIGPHTDSTYFTDPIGLQLFHLLHHDGEGGHTVLVDAFNVAEKLRKSHPEHFTALSTIPVPCHSAGDKSVLVTPVPRFGYPIIRVDPSTNKVFQIRYNNHDRSVLSGKHYGKEEIEKFYDALAVWTSMLAQPENILHVKMQPGRALIVDNWRFLHGRTSFTGNRRLCGAYINWDDYMSRVETVLNGRKMEQDL